METSYRALGRELIRRSGQAMGRRGARAVVPVATAALLSACLAAPAVASASSQHTQKYTISSVPGGKAVAAAQSTTAAQTAAAVQAASSSPEYALVSKASGKVLDASGSVHLGAPIIIYPWHNGTNQLWRPVGDSVENRSLVELQVTSDTMHYCIWGDHVGSPSGGEYSQVSLGLCNGAASEQFTAVHDPNDVLYIAFVNESDGLCLDVRGNSTASGTQVGLYECGDFQANQLWKSEKK